jgi:hypothetical protein
VEQSYRLPSEYSEVSDNQSIDNIDGKDIDLQTIESLADLDDSNTYKMIGEETPVISSSNAPINTSKVSGSNITQLEENEEEAKNNNSTESREEKNSQQLDVDLSSLIKEIDDKILNLETSLKNTTNNITNNNFEQLSEVSDKIVDNEVVNNSFNVNNNTDNVENIKNTIKQINELKDLKKTYENNLISSKKLTENIFNDTGRVVYDNFSSSVLNGDSNNFNNENNFASKDTNLSSENNNLENNSEVFNNFTPNLRIDPSDPDFDPDTPKPFKQEKEKATERAVATERAMGGDPKVEVVPGIGEVVIDDSSQDSFKDAVQQHGGLEDAISDSISSQENFISNENIEEKTFSNQDSIDNSIYNTSNNEDVSTTTQDSTYDNLPNYNADILKNSGDSLAVLTAISKQLDTISKSLGKNFSNLSSSIKDIKTTQQNTYYQNNSNSTSNNSPATPTASKSEPSLIPEVRGDKPLTEDFPKNFNMDSLFSNLRP